jgi:hypothetical protein
MRERPSTVPTLESPEAFERELERMLKETDTHIESVERGLLLWTTQIERLDAMPHDDVAEDNAYHFLRNYLFSQIVEADELLVALREHRAAVQERLTAPPSSSA